MRRCGLARTRIPGVRATVPGCAPVSARPLTSSFRSGSAPDISSKCRPSVGRTRPFSVVYAPHRRLSAASRTLIDMRVASASRACNDSNTGGPGSNVRRRLHLSASPRGAPGRACAPASMRSSRRLNRPEQARHPRPRDHGRCGHKQVAGRRHVPRSGGKRFRRFHNRDGDTGIEHARRAPEYGRGERVRARMKRVTHMHRSSKDAAVQ